MVPIGTLADLVNIGTLFAFALVAIGVLVLRRTDPDRERPFRVPLLPVVSVLTVLMSGTLVATLGATNFIRFGVWLVLGVIVYFAYSRPRSTVGRRGEATA
jgi:APA family basic amino acid/polyamine antiporter